MTFFSSDTAAARLSAVMTKNGMAMPAPSGAPANIILTTIAETASPSVMAFSTKTEVSK